MRAEPNAFVGLAVAEERAPEYQWRLSAAGASAEAEFGRRRARNRARIKRQWPFALGFGVAVCAIAAAVVQAVTDQPMLTALVVGVLALVQMAGFLQNSTVRSWRVGAEGERRTAAALEPLRHEGFVVLHDRKVAGYGGNLDHFVIGPTGLWAIETKSLTGKVEIHGDTLLIGGHRRDKIVAQVKQEATVIQVALGESLATLGIHVIPVICLHRAELPFFNKTVGGVRLASGRQLLKLLRTGNPVLSKTQIEMLARDADRVLKPALS